MNTKLNYKPLILGCSLFIGLVALYISTFSDCLMFDDAAEFALVIRQGSIAHSPGFPAYILAGMGWDRLAGLFISDTVLRLNLLAAFSIATACTLMYMAFRSIVRILTDGKMEWQEELTALLPALIFGVGNTTWTWANTIEVYSFQVFAMGLVLFGLCGYQETRSRFRLVIAAVGFAIGWGNHHLTMIAFTPFVPLFFGTELFKRKLAVTDKKKKSNTKNKHWFVEYTETIISKDFLLFTAISAILTIGFYGWMLLRAQQDYYFMFGKPENLDLLFYHLRGGAYTKNLTDTSFDISMSRLPFFLSLTFHQFLFFFPLLLVGLYLGFQKKAYKLMSATLLFYLILLAYQLRNNQWANTDAYLLLPFMTLCIPVIYATHAFIKTLKLSILIPCLAIATIFLGLEKHDRSTYPVSRDLMNLLDKSAPKNSVVVLSDWTTIIQYMFYRYEYGFRKDLDVIHYDFKFCHYKSFPINNPQLYDSVKVEYDSYISELRKDQFYNTVNTGCVLLNPDVRSSFQKLLNRIESVCGNSGRVFLTDPRSHYTFSTEKFYEPGRYVSGCFSSGSVCDSSYSDEFLKMNLPFLRSPLLLEDPSCLDKMVDFQAMLDQHISFYTANNDPAHLQKATNAKDKILRTQRDLKKSMSFAYKIK
ncbi:MAG: protein O-mannosyl-transferase family [Bacteroidota bacterium]